MTTTKPQRSRTGPVFPAGYTQKPTDEPMATKPQHTPRPEVGMIFKVYGQDCRITRVLPAGTIDVVTLDESHSYRVTGLPFTVTP